MVGQLPLMGNIRTAVPLAEVPDLSPASPLLPAEGLVNSYQHSLPQLHPQPCSSPVKTEQGATNSFVPAHEACLALLFCIW